MSDDLGIECDDFLRPAHEHVLALRNNGVGTELVHDLLDYAIATSRADAGCIYLFIAATSRLRQVVSRNIPPELAAIELSLGQGVAGAAAAHRATQRIDHYPTHPLAREPFLSEGLQAPSSTDSSRFLSPRRAGAHHRVQRVVILWLGNGPLSKVAIAFYLSFFPITVSVVKGLQSCDPASVALLRTFGARPLSILWKLRMPVMLSFLFVAMRVATTTALIGAIVGEWFGDNRGISTLILQSLYAEDTVRLWCGIVACAVMGMLFYGAVALVER
jgi:hypothetical protein